MTSFIFTGPNILAGGSGGSGGGGGGLDFFVPLLLMGVIFYFLLIRPQRKRQKALEAQIGAMKKGDNVISAGGIHGTIANIKETSVIVRVSDNVKIEFEKTSITTVIPKGSGKKSDWEELEEEAAAKAS